MLHKQHWMTAIYNLTKKVLTGNSSNQLRYKIAFTCIYILWYKTWFISYRIAYDNTYVHLLAQCRNILCSIFLLTFIIVYCKGWTECDSTTDKARCWFWDVRIQHSFKKPVSLVFILVQYTNPLCPLCSCICVHIDASFFWDEGFLFFFFTNCFPHD